MQIVKHALIPTTLIGMLLAPLPAAGNGPPPTVSTEMFDQIIALNNERPDIPPELLPATTPPATAPAVASGDARDAARRLCGLTRREISFSVPKSIPDPALGPDRSRYEITKSLLPVLLGPEGETARASPLFVVTDVMAVNVDGSPRAYHPRDIFGTSCAVPAGAAGAKVATNGTQPACALNFLCYAGVRLYDGARPIRCSNREEYQRYWDEMWSLIETGRAMRIPEQYWARDPSRAVDRRYGFFHPEKPVTVLFKDTIIPRDTERLPCIRDVAGARYYGFFVGATSLKGRERKDEPEGQVASEIASDRRCNPIPYVNAETLPNLVIPKGGFAGAKVGDLVVAYRKARDGQERWVFAIVGDEGPNDKFGEGSMAFNAALKGISKTWSSYRELARDLHIGERGAKQETIGILLFRNTAGATAGDLSAGNVASKAEQAFRGWGAGSLDAAKRRFLACMSALD